MHITGVARRFLRVTSQQHGHRQVDLAAVVASGGISTLDDLRAIRNGSRAMLNAVEGAPAARR